MQTVLVTGGATGIGKAISQLFAKQGYNVYICYNKSKPQAEKLQQELANLGYSVKIYQADITDSKQRKNLVKDIEKTFGGVDILINNAGIDHYGVCQEVTEEIYDNLFNVNMKSAFFLTNEVLPFMLNNKYGKIINISSIWGISGASCEVLYSASKSAVSMITYGMRMELKDFGIDVTSICPGDIKTNFSKNRDITLITNEKYGDKIKKSCDKIASGEHKRMDKEFACKKIFKICNKKHLKPMYIIGKKYKFFNFYK